MEPTLDETLLTAYLDGELSSQERQHLEQRLAHEPELRQRLVLLEETWHCLDLLEQEKPDVEQIETTLKVAAISLSNVPLAKRQINRLGKWIIAPILCVMLFAAAFQFGSWSPLDDPSFRPMVERLDLYLAISDDGVELLRQLAVRRVFLPPRPDDVPPIEPKEYEPSLRFSQFFKILDVLIPYHRSAAGEAEASPLFYKNIQRHRTLSQEKAKQIHQLHQDIENAPQSVELILTLQNYYHWLKSLQSYEKADLKRTRQLDKKVADIIALKNRLDARLSGDAGLVPSEVVGIDESEHLAAALATLPSWQQEILLNEDPNQIINALKQSFSAESEINDNNGD